MLGCFQRKQASKGLKIDQAIPSASRQKQEQLFCPKADPATELLTALKLAALGGPKHNAEAKMQFWYTLRISCNCNTLP